MCLLLLGIILIVCGMMGMRLFFIHKELKLLSQQLDLCSSKSNRRLQLTLNDIRLEELAQKINQTLDKHHNEQIEILLMEEELKKEIASMSHDLRTPLTSVIGYVQMIKRGNLSPEKQMEYLDIIEKRAKSLNVLVQNFFELSLIEEGKYPMQIQRENVVNLVCESVAEYHEDLERENVALKLQLPDTPVMMDCCSLALKRVFHNLIQNAIHHGEKNLDITLTQKENKVQFIFSNQATKLTHKDIPYLFNRSYTADQSRNNKSTGLGLYIAKKLVQDMGGVIEAKLKEGVFSIYLTYRIDLPEV